MCGEQRRYSIVVLLVMGSSPRVRGAVVTMHFVKAPHGIIPACAGSRASNGGRAQYVWDHPRVCGEQQSGLTPYRAYPGSSPRVRGAVPVLPVTKTLAGIIPACAGSRPDLINPRTMARDHPRVCGEQRLRATAAARSMGSSPRVRGAGCHLATGERVYGIIPACAGSRRLKKV